MLEGFRHRLSRQPVRQVRGFQKEHLFVAGVLQGNKRHPPLSTGPGAVARQAVSVRQLRPQWGRQGFEWDKACSLHGSGSLAEPLHPHGVAGAVCAGRPGGAGGSAEVAAGVGATKPALQNPHQTGCSAASSGRWQQSLRR